MKITRDQTCNRLSMLSLFCKTCLKQSLSWSDFCHLPCNLLPSRCNGHYSHSGSIALSHGNYTLSLCIVMKCMLFSLWKSDRGVVMLGMLLWCSSSLRKKNTKGNWPCCCGVELRVDWKITAAWCCGDQDKPGEMDSRPVLHVLHVQLSLFNEHQWVEKYTMASATDEKAGS